MNQVFGIHAVRMVLRQNPLHVKTVLLNENRKDSRLIEIEQLAQRRGIAIQKVSTRQLNELARGLRHQGAAAMCHSGAQTEIKIKITEWCEGLGHIPLIVALDSIQDPRNLGACIRSANCAGAAVVIPKRKGTPITETVSRTAAGAVESTPIFESTNLARDLDLLKQKGFWVIGLDSKAQESVYRADLQDSCVLVFGSEDQGLRRQTAVKCDLLVQVPLVGTVESLNVSVAVGVVAFEAQRQRQAALASSK